MIPYGRQEITQSDIEAVLEVLHSDYLTQGPKVPLFEESVANYCGATYGVAVNSATSGLHIACLALGLSEGDLLWTTPITFVASANCGLYCGAEIDFVDIDPRTYNLCPSALELKLIEADKIGRLPKVLVVVHLCGQSCDMAAIDRLRKKYGFRIIEDASHAIGGKYEGKLLGSCRYSDITVFSFHPVKIITTAEGGMVLTNNSDLAERMNLLRCHGVTRDPTKMRFSPDGPWYYEQISLGYNFRMTELQAAIGLSQLGRLEEYVAKRHLLADRYDAKLIGMSVERPWQHPSSWSAFHLYIVRCPAEARFKVFDYMRSKGIGVNVHYIPVHLQPYYQKLGFRRGDFPVAENYYAGAISLPLFPTLTRSDQDKVVNHLGIALEKFA